LPSGFWEQLPLKTEAELYDRLAHQDDYQPEAPTAAEEELRKRNLAPETVAQLEAKVQSQKAAAETKAQEPLAGPCGSSFSAPVFLGLFGGVLR